MEKYINNWTLKGDRNYLQGANIFDEVTQIFGAREDGYIANLRFKAFARNHCLITTRPPEIEAAAIGVWRSSSSEEQFWVVEQNEPIEVAVPYDEQRILDQTNIEGQSISADYVPGFSTIEQVIALTKALNYNLSPDIDGSWIFAEARLTAKLPGAWTNCRITRTAIIGSSFSRNTLQVDEAEFGDIRFMATNP